MLTTILKVFFPFLIKDCARLYWSLNRHLIKVIHLDGAPKIYLGMNHKGKMSIIPGPGVST